MDSRVFSAVVRLLSGSLNQSPDNPIQLDRLPDDSAVELDYPVFQDAPSAARRRLLLIVFVTSIIGPALAWFGGIIPVPYLSGGLYTAAAIFAGVMIVLGAIGRWWPSACYVVAVAVVPILVMLAEDQRPGHTALLLAVVGAGCLALSLSTASVYLRTAAPAPRSTAAEVRRLWRRRWMNFSRPLKGTELIHFDFLILPAVAAGLFIYLAETNGRGDLRQSAIALCAVALFAVVSSTFVEHAAELLYGRPRLSLKARFQAFINALSEWTGYNRLNTRAPGVHRCAGGPCSARVRLLIGTVAAWSCVWAGLQLKVQPSLDGETHAAILALVKARVAREIGVMKQDPKTPDPDFEAPPLTDDEQEFLARLSDQAKQDYLTQRKRIYYETSGRTIEKIRDEVQYGRPAEQLASLLRTLGRVTVRALVPSLATIIALGGLLFGMTSRALAGIDSALKAGPRRRVLSTQNWETLVTRIQSSDDEIESQSVLLGANSRDDTPILVPRRIFKEHAHVLGDSGSGKTTVGLMPLISQLMRFGDTSIVLIDLKADKQNLFESLRKEAAEVPNWVRSVRGQEPKFPDYPFRWFTTVLGQSSYAFNPLRQRVMPKLAPDQRTDILTAALGLQYGTDYGRKYFGDANYEVLNYALRESPNVGSLMELEQILAGLHRFAIPEETRRAGTNVLSSVRRLARCKALNACEAAGTPSAVLDSAIDLDDIFTKPQALYFALPPSAGIANTAEIARMTLYSLLAAAQKHEGERKQVFLIVDEFQRIVSNNVELFLQQARSMNIGCIFSNQSVGDLLKVDADLLSAVRTNTRFRQVFGAGAPEDIRELVETSGETVRGIRQWNYVPGMFEATLKGMSLTEKVDHRLTTTDVLRATDAEGRSIACVRRGDGYAQFGGMPFVMDSVYHVPFLEYDARETAAWPSPTPETVVATLDDYAKPTAPGARVLGALAPDRTVDQDVKAAQTPAAAAGGTSEQPEPDTASSSGLSDDFLEAIYQEQKLKAQAMAKRKKRARRNSNRES